MKTLQWALCGLVLSLAACVDSAAPSEPEDTPATDTAELTTTKMMSMDNWLLRQKTSSSIADTCTWTLITACRVGQCELGANDHFERWEEVCCNDAGACTTQRWRICGC